MRSGKWFAGLVLLVGMAAAAYAQNGGQNVPWSSGSSFMTGVSPGQRVYQPVDMSNCIAPIPQAPRRKWWDLKSLFKKKTPSYAPLPTRVSPDGGVPAPSNLSALQPAPGR